MKAPLFVYFIQSGRAVKIGVTTDVDKRRDALQAGNPEPLFVIGAVRGDWRLESELHARFAAGRIHREWFDMDTPGLGDLLRHVFLHGEIPGHAAYGGDEVKEPACLSCGWPQEPGLADLEWANRRCGACLEAEEPVLVAYLRDRAAEILMQYAEDSFRSKAA